jgi:hypothetical protein
LGPKGASSPNLKTRGELSIFGPMSDTRPGSLTEQEFEALKQIGDARAPAAIPPRMRERLISIGYIRDDHGKLVVTDEGMLRIISGI